MKSPLGIWTLNKSLRNCRCCFWATLITCLLLVFPDRQALAQRNNVWMFGNHSGLDFNSGAPVAVSSGMMANEGSASVCDEGGQLLFYTNGMKIWDRNNNVMPNGNNVSTYLCESTTQAALIVPIPDSSNLYYVFSMEGLSSGRLFYCVVDMSLNNGNGDIVPGRKNIVMGYSFTEKMIAVRGNDCNVWLMIHDNGSHTFSAYSITKEGIGQPVTSVTGTISVSAGWPQNISYEMGVMKISPDRKRLVLSNFFEAAELYDFDPSTGIVSNAATMGADSKAYGACFSPDGTKLYLSTNYFDGGGFFDDILQYDITLPTMAAIQASRTIVHTMSFPSFLTNAGDLKLAPDGKIYISMPLRNDLQCINFPNLAGIACQVTNGAVNLTDTAMYGLPNEVVTARATDTISTVADLVYCYEQPVFMEALTGYNYLWEDGSTDSVRMASTSGTYYVSYKTSPCQIRRDTFRVRFEQILPTVSTAEKHCGDAAFMVHPAVGDTTACTYTWINAQGDTVRQSQQYQYGDTLNYPVSASGIQQYSLHIQTPNGCDTLLQLTDTIDYEVIALSDVTSDTIIAYGSSLQLYANGALYYTWLPDSWLDYPNVYNPIATPKEPVIFSVIGMNEYGCKDTAYVKVGIDYTMNESIPTAFSPNGDGINDLFRPLGLKYQKLQEFRIFNRWGQEVFVTTDAMASWDGSYKGEPQTTGVYHYLVRVALPDGQLRTYEGEVTLVR